MTITPAHVAGAVSGLVGTLAAVVYLSSIDEIDTGFELLGVVPLVGAATAVAALVLAATGRGFGEVVGPVAVAATAVPAVLWLARPDAVGASGIVFVVVVAGVGNGAGAIAGWPVGAAVAAVRRRRPPGASDRSPHL